MAVAKVRGDVPLAIAQHDIGGLRSCPRELPEEVIADYLRATLPLLITAEPNGKDFLAAGCGTEATAAAGGGHQPDDPLNTNTVRCCDRIHFQMCCLTREREAITGEALPMPCSICTTVEPSGSASAKPGTSQPGTSSPKYAADAGAGRQRSNNALSSTCDTVPAKEWKVPSPAISRAAVRNAVHAVRRARRQR